MVARSFTRWQGRWPQQRKDAAQPVSAPRGWPDVDAGFARTLTAYVTRWLSRERTTANETSSGLAGHRAAPRHRARVQCQQELQLDFKRKPIRQHVYEYETRQRRLLRQISLHGESRIRKSGG